MTKLVKIDPPLPFTSSGDWKGFVTGLSQDQIHVSSRPRTGGSWQMDIALPGCIEPILIKGDWDDQAGYLRVPSDQRAPLKDLLGRLRKDQHITLCREEDVEASKRYTGFDDVTLLPKALPELSLDQINLETIFLGYKSSLPLLITGMTGGVEQGQTINHRLALAASRHKIPMGIGSQRIALENPKLAPIFAVKNLVPDVFLIGNIGFAQLGKELDLKATVRAVEMIGADALAIHVNVLQEMVQVEGDRDFRGIIDAIGEVCTRLSVPVLVKEVGSGLDVESALALKKAGVKALDVGGSGGTSWPFIEGKRALDPSTQRLGGLFRDWGIPTAYAVAGLRKAGIDLPLVATGGIRDGLAVAKAVALGADLAGIGLPLFRAALDHEDGPSELIENIKRELQVAMICSGVNEVSGLNQRLRLSQRFQDQLAGSYQQRS